MTRTLSRPAAFLLTLVLLAALLLAFGLALSGAQGVQAQDGTAPNSSLDEPDPVCFAETDGDNVTDFSTWDAWAVQDAVNAAAPGTTIKLAGYCRGVYEVGGFTQTVQISKNLTLQGGYTNTNWLADPDSSMYTTTLDAKRAGRVVLVTDTAKVNLNHLTITEGKTPDLVSGSHGGGIYSYGALTVSHTTVFSNATGNKSEFGNGGSGAGIYSLGWLNLYTTTVTSNTAGHGNTGGMGGGIYVSGTLALHNSRLSENHAGDGGSGVNGGHGGGVFARGTVEIDHGLIISNTSGDGDFGAVGDGAGIYSQGQISVTSTTVRGNATGTCVSTTCSGAGSGGGLRALDSEVFIQDSVFRLNRAGDDGGGVLVADNSTLMATGITAEGNEAGNIGGGVLIRNGTNATAADFHLSGNRAGATGGGLAVRNTSWLTLDGAFVYSNTASTEGGGLEVANGGILTLTNSVIYSNTSLSLGGGVVVKAGGRLTITSAAIISNSSSHAGGGAYLQSGGSVAATDVTIADNQAGAQGGGIGLQSGGYLTGTNLTISGNGVTTSTASSNGGGAIHTWSGARVDLTYSTIAHNSAPNLTGRDGISVAVTANPITLTASLVANNGTENCADAGGLIRDGGHNLDSGSSCGLTQTTNLTDTAALIGPLADNSGPALYGGTVMQTHALLDGSPALEHILPGSALCGTQVTADQRGFSRPQGANCDIGAFESRALTLTVTLAGSGGGSVRASGIDCAGDCSEAYLEQTVVTLTATADLDSTFEGWGGVCSGTSASCLVTMSESQLASATFDIIEYKVFLPVVMR